MVLGHSLTMAVHPWTGQFVYVARSDNGPGSSKLLRAHQSPVPEFFFKSMAVSRFVPLSFKYSTVGFLQQHHC